MTSALEAAEQAVAQRPGDAALWYQLGLARLDAGQLPQSEACWRKVLALEPGHARASVNLGLVLQHSGREEEALGQYRNAVAADAGLGQARFNLGALLLGRGRALEAVEPLRAAVRLDAGRADWRAALASALTAYFDAAPVPPRPARARREPRVVLDGVFFQDFDTDISRVWQSLLQEWVASGFARHIVLLDRQDTAPPIAGVRRRVVPRHDYARLDEDRAMLERVCDEEGATAFVSTYYSNPLRTPAVMVAYDMIPEVFGADFGDPMWREKATCIRNARRFVTISASTARDLCGFYPEADPGRVTVAHCGVSRLFRQASAAEVDDFRRRHGIARPYFLLVGARGAYKNAQAFLRAFGSFRDRARFAVVCVGGEKNLEPELATLKEGIERHMLRLEDPELRLAYAGAVALAYPSVYEGFGMPVAEAMACGCPVITTRSSSLPEVAGDAALYVDPADEAALHEALLKVAAPAQRAQMIERGLERAQRFSWTTMAGIVAGALEEAA